MMKAAIVTLRERWQQLTGLKYFWPVFLAAGLAFCVAADRYDFVDLYLQLIIIYVGINIILTVSLNLINGYMGEFSVGHAGFMAVGAYIASILTVFCFPRRFWPAAWARRWSAFWWPFPPLKHEAITWPSSRLLSA